MYFENNFLVPFVLADYNNDFLGGPISLGSLSKDEANAKLLLKTLNDIGYHTNTFMNREKCAGPRMCLKIFGLYYNTIEKTPI